MVSKAKTKIYETKNRHFIYLPKDLVTDSMFPFKVGDRLVVRIEAERLVVERGDPDER